VPLSLQSEIYIKHDLENKLISGAPKPVKSL